MIKSFKDREAENIFYRQRSSKLPQDIQRIALRKLIMSDNAHSLTDLLIPPGNHLEKLKGNRKGLHSIRINQQYRVCFEWKEGEVYDVEIIDYH